MGSSNLISFGLVLAAVIYIVNCSVVMYDVAIVPEECLKNKAIDSNYTPAGEEVVLGNLTVYESPKQNANRVLIAVYDIFGFSNPNMKQVSDKISEESGGFKVVLPDFYRGESWDPANFPPEDPNELQEWLQRVGDWENVVKPDLLNVVNFYREKEGIEEFAIFGMCWGGKVATLAATFMGTEFKAAGIVHPSSVTNEEAVGVQIPMYLMPTSSEPDMTPFYRILLEKFGRNSGHRRFDDMTHGFAGARGNFSDPINQARVEEVISKLGEFFNFNLPLNAKNDGNSSANPGCAAQQYLSTTVLILTYLNLLNFKM